MLSNDLFIFFSLIMFLFLFFSPSSILLPVCRCASWAGGAVFSSGKAALSLSHCQLQYNSAALGGGALYAVNRLSVRIIHSDEGKKHLKHTALDRNRQRKRERERGREGLCV